MENTSKVHVRRGRGLKFDQEWKDAVDRLPKHYRDEICAAIEAYQRDLTVIEVSEGVPPRHIHAHHAHDTPPLSCP